MVMIQVQTADEDRLLGAVQLAFDQAIVGTAACFQRQSAISPELALPRKRNGVCTRAISKAARIGPRKGILVSIAVAACLRHSQTDRAGPGGGIPAKHRAAQTCVPRGSGDRLALVLSATARAGVSCITSCPRWQSPGCGTVLSAGSSLE